MQACRAILVDALHLGHQQVAFTEEGPDGQLVGAGASAQDAAGQVDGAQRQDRQQRSRKVNFPPLRLHLDDPAHDQIADFGRVACAQGPDRQQFVCFLDCAGHGGDDHGAGVGRKSAMTSTFGQLVAGEGWSMQAIERLVEGEEA